MKHLIVIISYKVPIESIGEQLIKEHFRVLQQGYESGHVLLYGPSEPENGMIIIARVESRQALGKALASDPLLESGLVSYDIKEFIPVQFPTTLQGWIDPLGFRYAEV